MNYQKRNSRWSVPGPHVTKLNPEQEAFFNAWVRQNAIPFDPMQPEPDYDMRGFYAAMLSGDPRANRNPKTGHFPDVWKTPTHQTFSAESIYATPDAPHWQGRFLIDKDGNILHANPPPQ